MDRTLKKSLLLGIVSLSIYCTSGVASASTGGDYTHENTNYDFWWNITDNNPGGEDYIDVNVSDNHSAVDSFTNVEFNSQGDTSPSLPVRGPYHDSNDTSWNISVYSSIGIFKTDNWQSCDLSKDDLEEQSQQNPVRVIINQVVDPYGRYPSSITIVRPSSGSCTLSLTLTERQISSK